GLRRGLPHRDGPGARPGGGVDRPRARAVRRRPHRRRGAHLHRGGVRQGRRSTRGRWAMKRLLSLVLLCAGLGLAAAAGGRPTEAVVQARHAAWHVAQGEQVQVPPTPAPEARLAAWWQASGLAWAGGIALVLVGAGLARA